MNRGRFLPLVVLVGSACAEPAPNPVVATPAYVVAQAAGQERATGSCVRRGMSSANVERLIGSPAFRLTSDIWIYQDFRVKGMPSADRYNTLVVTLKNQRVVDLKMVDERDIRPLIIRLQLATTRPNRRRGG